MPATAQLARGRRTAEALMADTCTVRRQTGKVLNPDTDLYVPTFDTIYTGPCRLKFQSTAVEGRELAEQILVAQLATLSLPYDTSAAVKTDDVVDITTQPVPTVIDGATTTRPLQLRIAGAFAQTIVTARRFPAEVLT